MRVLRVLPLILTIVLIWLLDNPLGSLPALGRLLDPVNGAMAAAEPVDQDFNKHLKLKDLQAPVEIWFEDRLVPHIRAQNDHDLYYAQGYIHAYFRLWQMDLQTRAAGGRVSEVVGTKTIEFDRGQRRKGMVLGARRSQEAMERDPRTKTMLDAYRDGINAFIRSLDYRSLPIEYKLMGFYPEEWTNLRTALMAKNLADDLTSKTDDIAYTLLREQLGQEEFDFLFPERISGSKPVIPEGTPFARPSLTIPPYPGDSVWANLPTNSSAGPLSQHVTFPPQGEGGDGGAKGSNNWAISGAHTASGKPILCNDPHLSLNLPSLWFEIQLTAPGVNVYGASLPGAPGIVIGFNQQISWGFTNNYRDVKDFYEIRTSSFPTSPPPSGQAGSGPWTRPAAYHFSGKEIPFEQSIEVIKVKGGKDVIDTVLYTLHGPVLHDPTFPDPAASGKLLACTWMAHRGSNELLATYLLNRAADYPAFTDAIKHFECPAQNIAYADGAGNIAMWGQGRFINKWKGQGKYVMRGDESATLWGEAIPMDENPHVLNPPQGYVASANQQVTDSTYPYWYNGSFVEWRSWEINELLQYANEHEDKKHSLDNAGAMQNWTGSELWQQVILFDSQGRYKVPLPDRPQVYPPMLNPASANASQFQVFWSRLYMDIWQDEFTVPPLVFPSFERTVQLLFSDSGSRYYDDRNTEIVESLDDIVQRALQETTDSLDRFAKAGSTSPASAKATVGEASPLAWYKVKNTTLTHLARIPAFSYPGLKIGGWSNTINAVTGSHGPSWRMIVEMDSIPKAYVVYPGGQSGNPGSPHYGDFVNHWVEGKYFTTQFLTAGTTTNPFKSTWTLSP